VEKYFSLIKMSIRCLKKEALDENSPALVGQEAEKRSQRGKALWEANRCVSLETGEHGAGEQEQIVQTDRKDTHEIFLFCQCRTSANTPAGDELKGFSAFPDQGLIP
jgi:hypothetical protein